MYRLGLDIGSTTIKLVVVDKGGDILFSNYTRHLSDVSYALHQSFNALKEVLPNEVFSLSVTGSVGMGLSEKFNIPFLQEVKASIDVVKQKFSNISTIIDIGGEDAKIVFINSQGNIDLRMNGNCAGGTGAFIDQMIALLGVNPEDFSSLVWDEKKIHPIASRCGVFSKTDVQNLISKNVPKEDIVMSVFHAVAVQCIGSLSHGMDIKPKVLFCGGPFTFNPALRKAFCHYLNIDESIDTITPENANLIPAWGSALSEDKTKQYSIDELISLFNDVDKNIKTTNSLPPLFETEKEYNLWKEEKKKNDIRILDIEDIKQGNEEIYIGIDSGSTTTKIVAINNNEDIVFSYYAFSQGKPIQCVKDGLLLLQKKISGTNIKIKGTCSTGYGEDLIKAAFNLDNGIIETIAHYLSARKFSKDVSFILDIGGQDMKAIFIENGAINKIEINEACSSGCGSFLSTFAQGLNLDIENFAFLACKANNPCDLGTRCTVFMNSKVKQVLREGANIEDIASGLSYSVVKNCLYKVLKIRDCSILGDNIVVQGGAMKNDSVVRAFEKVSNSKVSRSNVAELMGAYGCAIYAKNNPTQRKTSIETTIDELRYETTNLICKGCENNCEVSKYTFSNNNIFYSGNRCEKVFSNSGDKKEKGFNIYPIKRELLFNRPTINNYKKNITIGIPRVLNMFENYPFWHSLFNECSIKTILSDKSTFKEYEKAVHSVMSDNICFPAKLVHSHIYNLIDKNVDRIFMPYIIYEQKEDNNSKNSYNCPIVSSYSDVIKSAINPKTKIDSPIINFKDTSLLIKGVTEYLQSLGVEKHIIVKAIKKALKSQEDYTKEIEEKNNEIYKRNKKEKRLTILLSARPYHTDQLIQHKISEMISDLGVDVISEDLYRSQKEENYSHSFHYVSQWAYTNRILKAAQRVAEDDNNIHFMQLTSFGCGPDAFLLDEIKAILKRGKKSLTILKIDDVDNIGSLKLRVRSLIESLKEDSATKKSLDAFKTTKPFDKKDKKRTIIVPYFTDFISPLMTSFFKLTGYNFEVLPKSDAQSSEEGLRYANNEVCYPATLIIGDIIKALKSGKYNLDNTAVAITQTGGQCRASNYLAMIKNALVEAGYRQVPVLSVALGDDMSNNQSGFEINWLKHIKIALYGVIFGDCLSKLYFAMLSREKTIGESLRLKDKYMERASRLVEENNPNSLLSLIREAAEEFNKIEIDNKEKKKIGVVGEIFLKFNSFAHKDILHTLSRNGFEIMPPMLLDFFLQSFVNIKFNKKNNISSSKMPNFIIDNIYKLVKKTINTFDKAISSFLFYNPMHDIFQTAKKAEKVISLASQAGEGWLLTGEIVCFAQEGVNNVISLQPFGCIANHIISKGVEKKIKSLYPNLNILYLDFDSGVSDVNIQNRLHLLN
ncbi:MAG: acyl-CoA dehydratase activase-related protein [Bacteroidales bacterium]|jgi:predicted CoA-substrate-specific enzyme activase|nr:acyl-CoA dehydratase activase-related protein [Bacteroidales bacterium]